MNALMFIFWISAESLVGGSISMEIQEFRTLESCDAAAAKIVAGKVRSDPDRMVLVCVLK